MDSQVAIDAFRGEGSRKSAELTDTTKRLYELTVSRNLNLELNHVPSKDNEADGPSRCLSSSDAMLSLDVWQKVQREFGGPEGHSFDLMALDSNVQCNRHGTPLPHFTRCPTPASKGVNLFAQDLSDDSLDMRNPYAFPPFCLITPVLKFMLEFRIPFTMVVPNSFPRQVWWPCLMGHSSRVIDLCAAGDKQTLLFPSKSGFRPRPSMNALVACRVSKY